MSKRYIDLNRSRKVYPLVRVKPKFVTARENLVLIEANRLEFNGITIQTYVFENSYVKTPVIILTPENENINAFISNIDLDTQSATIQISEIPDDELDCNVYVHIQVISQD